jgi:hypothetical protein
VSADLTLVTDDIITTWADRIRGHMARTVEAIVATGATLVQAKAEVGHGNWLPLLERVGMGEDTAERFMAIAGNGAFLNSALVRNLPASYTTLAILAPLDPDEIVEAVEAGKITPATTKSDAVALVKTNGATKITTKTPTVYTGNIVLDADRHEMFKGRPHRRPDDVIERTVEQIRHMGENLYPLSLGPEHINPEKAPGWLEDIDNSIRELRKFRRMFAAVVAQQADQ